MPEIAPFAAVRYRQARTSGDLSTLIAPPYDVLDENDKRVLLGASDRNIVAIDLPHIPPKQAGPAEVYQRSAHLLDEWLADGTLAPESQPALYLYHQQFEHAGTQYTRRMFIARVRLQPFSHGSILPHEQTFGGPKEDRLALMKATKCQLSPIFGLYSDPQDRIGSAFAATGSAVKRSSATGGTVKRSLAVDTPEAGDADDPRARIPSHAGDANAGARIPSHAADANAGARIPSRTPDVTARLDGVENRMWIVTDGDTIRTVRAEMADKKVYIADGHHRYGTALLYRDWFKAQQGGSIPDDHAANYIMFVLASMDDPGCLILPYHRVLAGVDIATVLDAWSQGVEAAAPRGSRSAPGSGDARRDSRTSLDVAAAPRGDRATAGGAAGQSADMLTEQSGSGQQTRQSPDIVLFDGATGQETPLRFTRRDILPSLESEQCPAWYKLDAAYLHRYLIDELLANALSAKQPKVIYVKSAEDARRTAREQSGVALLVNATPMAHLRAVSEQGGLMPQKSTYFHPKLATGLTINPLE